jgi:hypothetical protein
MFRRIATIVIAATMAAAGLLFVSSAPASAATVNRSLAIWGNLHIEDYETFGSNEHCYFSLNTTRPANSNYPIIFDWSKPCGGEIRSELHVQAQVQSNKYIHVYGDILFFEGTTEGTSDLDGQLDFSMYVPPNTSIPFNQVVWNTDEGDCDCATYNLRFGNYTP